MGNTKLVYLSGETKRLPSDADIRDALSAEYASVRAWPGGYLNHPPYAKPQMPSDVSFILAAAHTSSMNANPEALAGFLTEWGDILVCDKDWTDARLVHVDKGRIEGQTRYGPHGDGPGQATCQRASGEDLAVERAGLLRELETLRLRDESANKLIAELRASKAVSAETAGALSQAKNDAETETRYWRGLVETLSEALARALRWREPAVIFLTALLLTGCMNGERKVELVADRPVGVFEGGLALGSGTRAQVTLQANAPHTLTVKAEGCEPETVTVRPVTDGGRVALYVLECLIFPPVILRLPFALGSGEFSDLEPATLVVKMRETGRR